MQFRVIPLSVNNGIMNMAIDDALLELASKGDSLPIIRFYNWNPSSVSLGYYQDISKINIENCKRLKVDYVRRPTGGGSILHDYDKEVTYSVVAPLSLYNRNLKEAYRKICEPLLSTLSYLSLNPYVSNTNDIMVNNKKISGNAQTWRGGALLQHGTMIYDLDLEKMLAVLNTSFTLEKAKEKITYVREYSDISLKELYKIMEENFCKGKDFLVSSLTKAEMDLANKLAENKYNTLNWDKEDDKGSREACYLN